MSAKHRLRFDIDVLRELAGEKVFARGAAYHRDGQVEILSIKPRRVLAQVAGTEDYRTELRGDGEDIDGECSCPAFEDLGFCKHMVATGLAANDLPAGEGDGSGALARIRDHLKEKGVDALVEMILDLVERDPALFRKLDAAAAAIHDDDKTLGARLRKMIDSATRTGNFVDYRGAPGWAAHVDSVLDSIAGLASGARAGLAIELVERAIDRIAGAIEQIDDSDGHCSMLLGRARDIHLAAVREVRPEPVRLARDLFGREMADDYGTFEGSVALYADMLGEAGLAEYRRLATEAWEKIPPYSGGKMQQEELAEFVGDRHQLMRILDFFAERAGEVDSRIALRARDLSSQWSYLQLAEFCLSHGREEEALRRAEEGLWMFEDERPDQPLVLFAAELLSKAGRKGDAETHLQRAFEKSPTLELYKRLCEFGGVAARERVFKFLEAKQASTEKIRWHNPGDLLIRIWMHEKMFDAAWAAVRKHGASMALKEQLAGDSEATHPGEALGVYAERVDQLADLGGAFAYAEAAQLVARMAALRPKAEQVAYVLALKERFGRRRNFMKLLG
jgi:tetratricopeptide (TPR) repeat protein